MDLLDTKPLLPALAFGVLKEIVSDNGVVSEERLQALYALFGNTAVSASELLESGRVVCYTAKSGLRKLFKVESRGDHYTIFGDINYCSCQAFRYHVLLSRTALTCKHVLAVKLALVTGQIKEEAVEEERFVGLLDVQLEK